MSKVANKVPHLSIRNGRFYFRLRVERPLIPMFGMEVSKALGDVTKKQAIVMVRELSADYAAQFLREKHRMGLVANPPVAAPPSTRARPATADDVATIAKVSARDLLARDESIRINGMRTETGDWWRSELLDLDDALGAALSDGDLRDVWHAFITDLRKAGLEPPPDRDERRALAHRWVMEQAKALQGIGAREDGIPFETPPPVVIAASEPTGHFMRDAFDAWKTSARRPEKTVKAFERHVETFEAMSGNPPLGTLRRADAVKFRDALQKWAVDNGKTARTADNTLTSIKALANVARDREWLEGNPFERLAVTKGGKDSEGREPWTPDELAVLFDHPIFTRYELPEGDSKATKAGRDAAYWVPLILAYAGARPSEVCQLWADDLSEEAGGLVIEFRDDDTRGQRLKGKRDSKKGPSWRAVPVHSELIRLGLREYWQSVPKDGPLFPALPKEGDNGAAGQFGQWFGDFKRERGFASATKTLHSMRHMVETELAFAGATPTLVDAITGHAGEGIGRKVYGATIRRSAERLRPVIELLAYEGLSLPRTFRA